MPLASTQGLERYQVRVVTAASSDPAANTEISYTIPTGQIFELYAANVTLVTDANAANRRVVLTIDNGTTVFVKAPSPQVQAASLTYNYTFAVGAPERATVDGTDMSVKLPGPLFLPGGYRILTVTASRQATDNFGAMTIQGIRYSA